MTVTQEYLSFSTLGFIEKHMNYLIVMLFFYISIRGSKFSIGYHDRNEHNRQT